MPEVNTLKAARQAVRAPSAAYWAKRAETRMTDYLSNAAAFERNTANLLLRTQRVMQASIEKIYLAYGKGGALTPDEALEWARNPVSHAGYEALLQQIASMPASPERARLMKRADSASVNWRIKREEALQMEIEAQVTRLKYQQRDALTKSLSKTVADAYNHTVYDIQRGTGIGFSFAKINTRAIEEILRNPWSGTSFSARVWKNANALQGALDEVMTAKALGRMTRQQASAHIAKACETSYAAAERLVRTETNYVANAAEIQSYRACGIEKYQYLAVLDSRTSEICRDLDGTVHDVATAKAGVNLPPMHPFCRSTTVMAMDRAEREGMLRRARDPVTGEYVTVPANMTYREWQAQNEAHYGKERMETAQKMSDNAGRDREQYRRYKELLGRGNMPETFAKFQQMKYTDVGTYDALKASYAERNAIQRARATIADMPKELNVGHQNKHIVGSPGYIEGRSYINGGLEEAQAIILEYSGTGIVRTTANGAWNHKEIITANRYSGVDVDQKTQAETETNRFTIHYGKNGAHIVPAKRRN